MGYYAAGSPNLFESRPFKEAYGARIFNVIDGGSRGAFFEPLDAVSDCWNIFAFDADVDAPAYKSKNIKKVNHGLWSESRSVRLHLAKEPSTSSVYPPDLALFDKLYGEELGTKVRETVREVDVDCLSVDDALARGIIDEPHFLKLDVHSSEYEAILGAKNSLQNCVCVLVETWTQPFHKGQKCHGDVEALLNSLGFYVYDIAPVYGYNQSSIYGKTVKGDRKFLTLTESVFFRPVVARAELAILHVALLDLFRYTNHALFMCAQYAKIGYIDRGVANEIELLLKSYPSKRSFDYRHRGFYARWLRNIVKAIVFPSRDVVYTGR